MKVIPSFIHHNYCYYYYLSIFFLSLFPSLLLLSVLYLHESLYPEPPPPLRGVFLIPKPNSFETLFNLFFFMSSV